MDTIAQFVESNAAAWEVTRSAFLSKLLDEIINFPTVCIVVKGTQTYLVNTTYLRVKVVNTTEDSTSHNGVSAGSDTES